MKFDSHSRLQKRWFLWAVATVLAATVMALVLGGPAHAVALL